MRIKEQIVATLRKNEVVHEEFKIGVSFGHILVNRADMKAVPFDGEQGIESLLEYLTRGEWEGLYEEDFLIGAQKGDVTVLLGAGGQIEFHHAKTDSLKVIDKAYLDFLQELGSELEARNQLMLSIGYQPVSKASEIETVPMVKAKLLAEALKDDAAALQTLKGRAKTVVKLDYAHNDDFEKKYRVVHTLAPVFAALLDNIPVVDGEDYAGFVAGLDMDDRMETALAKVENVMSSHSFKYAQYANITGNAPAVAIEENGAIAACDKSNEEAYENVTVTLLSNSNGFKMDENSVMIQSLVNAYKEVTKDYDAKPICIGGGTYAREFNNCVAFGPEMEGYGEIIIHQPNERIQIRAIEDIMKIYFKAYADLITKVSF